MVCKRLARPDSGFLVALLRGKEETKTQFLVDDNVREKISEGKLIFFKWLFLVLVLSSLKLGWPSLTLNIKSYSPIGNMAP